MKVAQINTVNSFQSLYKIDRKYIGDNTEQFLCTNDNVIATQKHWDDDIFVLTPSSKDNKFEQSVKHDNGKYWKSKPLSQLMMYSNLLKEIYRINYISNDYHEDWIDFTDKWESSENAEDEIPF